MRLGYLACIASLVGCAQGVESPGTENLTNLTNTGGSSSSAGGSNPVASAGSHSAPQAGAASSAAGSSSAGSSSAGSSSAGSTSAGSSSGGSSSGGSSASGSSGAPAGGAGPTTGMCGHPQPGNMGPTLESKLENATGALYFSVKIDNVDDRDVHLSDLKFRYYVDTSALGTLATEFYQKDITAVSKTTRQLSGDPTASVSPTYIEYSFPGSSDIIQMGESLTLKVHTHNDMYKTPDQTADYSFNSSMAFVPWCKIVLYEQAPVAWGTTPP